MNDIQRVAVLGFGTMGAGIAQVVAQSGREVTVLETDQSRLDAGRTFLHDILAGGFRRGKFDEAGRDAISARVTGVTSPDEIGHVDLVIEAVTERVDVKKQLLAVVSSVVAEDAIIATNTSALSVTDLATSVNHPRRFAGLHFFNPAPAMKVVEIVDALQTDALVVERLVAFVEAIGRNPVVVKDRPGFLVNWLLLPYLNDVIQSYDEELASAEDIDTAMKLGLGYKLGPMELLDMIGLDVHEHASASAYTATYDPRFAPPPLLSQMVAAGRLGNKNGAGFRSSEES